MTPATQTHNRHLDATRALVAASAFPTPIDDHDLNCAMNLAEAARSMLVQAYKLIRADHALSIKCETAGTCCKELRRSIDARITGAIQ